MTPAIAALNRAKIDYITHQYQHQSNGQSYGLEAAEKLNLATESVFKTLVVKSESNQLAVAIIPVAYQLNLKLMAKAFKTKKVQMAPAAEVERSTGYILGGVSPIGQKKRLVTFIDKSAQNQTTVFVSAGRRGLEVELSPTELAQMTKATFTNLTSI